MASLSDDKRAELATSFGLPESAVAHYASMGAAESRVVPAHVESELRQRYDWTSEKVDDFWRALLAEVTRP